MFATFYTILYPIICIYWKRFDFRMKRDRIKLVAIFAHRHSQYQRSFLCDASFSILDLKSPVLLPSPNLLFLI